MQFTHAGTQKDGRLVTNKDDKAWTHLWLKEKLGWTQEARMGFLYIYVCVYVWFIYVCMWLYVSVCKYGFIYVYGIYIYMYK